MLSGLPLLLALALAVDVPPVDRPTRPAVKVLAFVGAASLSLGLSFELTGRAGSDPLAPVLEWSERAEAYRVGGFALMGVGLCLVGIAALLTPWHFPSLALHLTPEGAFFAVGARWP